jgi:hypothetical protein
MSTLRVEDSTNAMDSMNEIISADGTGNITVIISGDATRP